MKDTGEAFKTLEQIAKRKGYEVIGAPLGGNYVNQTKKTIVMQAFINDEANIKMTHELGHVYCFGIWKWLVFINELTSWIIGYFICKKNKISTENFWNIMKDCLKSYIKL